MNILLFGIHKLGREVLEQLQSKHTILAAITKPGGPGAEEMIASAKVLSIPILQPESPRDAEFIRFANDLSPDVTVVAGYHKIIPPGVLKAARLGTINVHPALLPRYRGPVPWKWAIIHGEEETGVTVHFMTPGLDDGDIIEQARLRIDPDDTERTLFARLATCGAQLVTDVVNRMCRGQVAAFPQNEADSTYYGYPTTEQMQVCWEEDAVCIRNLVRGLSPSPGAWAILNNVKVTLWDVRVMPEPSESNPGTILSMSASGILVATRSNNILLTSLTPDLRALN
jgi:methionyl-tRNA formyltransferase